MVHYPVCFQCYNMTQNFTSAIVITSLNYYQRTTQQPIQTIKSGPRLNSFSLSSNQRALQVYVLLIVRSQSNRPRSEHLSVNYISIFFSAVSSVVKKFRLPFIPAHLTPALRDSDADFPGIYCSTSAPSPVNLKLRWAADLKENGGGRMPSFGRKPVACAEINLLQSERSAPEEYFRITYIW